MATTSNDRMPPQNIDAERSVLGAMLLNPDAVGTVTEILHGSGNEVFYAPSHQHIYDAIISLYSNSKPIAAIAAGGGVL